MKIIRLTAENVKRLSAVEVVPSKDGLTIIAGKNAQGKSSILDSIAYALGGTRLIPDKPIREGADKAEIKVELGVGEIDYIVTRSFTPSGSYLKIETPEGAQLKSPQAILDKLLGDLTFDPLGFIRMAPKEQRNVLLGAAGIDFTPIEEKKVAAFQKRRDVNRDAKALKAVLDQAQAFAEDLPADVVSVAELSGKLTAAVSHNNALEDAAGELTHIELSVKKVEAALAEERKRLTDAKKHLASLGEAQDAESLDSAIANAEARNTQVRAKQQFDTTSGEFNALEGQSAELTEEIRLLDEAKSLTLQNADLPIDGIGISEDGVTYQEIPFEQASQAEQLLISTAIGMALSPELHVIRIADGSLLDPDSLELLRTFAQEKDYDIWIERVEEGGATVVVEDGCIKV